jgi:hypothetical protein
LDHDSAASVLHPDPEKIDHSQDGNSKSGTSPYANLDQAGRRASQNFAAGRKKGGLLPSVSLRGCCATTRPTEQGKIPPIEKTGGIFNY